MEGIKIFKLLSLTILLIPLMTTQSFAKEENIIAGETRFETSLEISKTWKISKEVILVNSTATPDMLCATTLASQKHCPILLTYENTIGKTTIKEIERLQTEKIYIIGGEKVITSNIEKELKNMNINTQRISGDDRYETSIKIADIIKEYNKVEKIVVVNGERGISDTISISSVAGNQNMPIIIAKKNELGQAEKWIDKQNIKSSYIIGGENSISQNTYDKIPNPTRIYGEDRYETNAKIIDKFYKNTEIDTVFYCNGSNVDAMLITPLAAKQNAPILVLGQDISYHQENIIRNKNIKNLVQVGYGVSEEAKKGLYEAKENYEKPKPPTSPKPPIEPEIPINPNPPVDPEIPTEPEPSIDTACPVYEKYTIDSEKKIITITFDEELEDNIENIKSKIKIDIDKNSIKLNKYDKVSIDGKNLMIYLDDKLIGLNSKIIIEGNTIKDKNENYIKEDTIIENIEGTNKTIAFVKDEDQLLKMIEDPSIDIIKLDSDIDILRTNTIRIKRKVIIDGSNGQENYNITLNGKELISSGISLENNDIVLKSVDITAPQEVITTLKVDGIKLKNINAYTKSQTTYTINLYDSKVIAQDLKLSSNYAGIVLISSRLSKTRSQLIINGYIYNINKDENEKNYPAIYIENYLKDEESNNLNKIELGENLDKDYIKNNYIHEVSYNQLNTKKYESYYKIENKN